MFGVVCTGSALAISRTFCTSCMPLCLAMASRQASLSTPQAWPWQAISVSDNCRRSVFAVVRAPSIVARCRAHRGECRSAGRRQRHRRERDEHQHAEHRHRVLIGALADCEARTAIDARTRLELAVEFCDLLGPGHRLRAFFEMVHFSVDMNLSALCNRSMLDQRHLMKQTQRNRNGRKCRKLPHKKSVFQSYRQESCIGSGIFRTQLRNCRYAATR